jgi:glucose/arabinose dehydrogenase
MRPVGVAVEADDTLLVIDSGSNALYRVDPRSGDRSVVSSADRGKGRPFTNPHNVTVEADGGILVFDDGIAALLRVDPRSGDRTVVSSNTVGKGTIFGEVWGIVVVPAP